MKGLFAILFVLLSLSFAYGQNEQAPIVEKDINYKNWTLKSIRTGEDVTLRDLTVGKKLVIVVYYSPWCPNWRHDAPFLQRFYDKYKANGLEIVAVGEYDPLASMKNNLDFAQDHFPRGRRIGTADRQAKNAALRIPPLGRRHAQLGFAVVHPARTVCL